MNKLCQLCQEPSIDVRKNLNADHPDPTQKRPQYRLHLRSLLSFHVFNPCEISMSNTLVLIQSSVKAKVNYKYSLYYCT